MSDDSSFFAPTVGGKWAPSFHPGLVPPFLCYTPTAPTPAAPVGVPIPHLDAYLAGAEDFTFLQGYRGLIRARHWDPIILDALIQIGVPYPTHSEGFSSEA